MARVDRTDLLCVLPLPHGRDPRGEQARHARLRARSPHLRNRVNRMRGGELLHRRAPHLASSPLARIHSSSAIRGASRLKTLTAAAQIATNREIAIANLTGPPIARSHGQGVPGFVTHLWARSKIGASGLRA